MAVAGMLMNIPHQVMTTELPEVRTNIACLMGFFFLPFSVLV